MAMTDQPYDAIVLGAGISGLAAALALGEARPDLRVAVLEASSRAGGVLQTDTRDGFLLERSADNFITDAPHTLEWCRRLGFDEQLVSTNAAHRGALVVRGGRLLPVPEGFLLMHPTRLRPALASELLSPAGKLRLLGEMFVPRRRAKPGHDESLASFARRRLGREAYERIVQPLVGGIYTADPERLSLRATLPRFLDMEQQHGSLYAAARAARRDAPARAPGDNAARYSLFVAPREGMASLVDAAIARLPAGTVQYETRATGLRRAHQGETARWVVTTQSPVGERELLAAAVIVALPAPAAAALVEGIDATLAGQLRAIEYASSLIALASYRREQIAHPLDAFGLVVPRVERREILACSFSSVKFAGRAPAGHELLRVFLGGALRGDQLELDDAEIERIVARELGELLGVRGAPVLFEVQRWRGAMPQYTLGHVERVRSIEAQAGTHQGFALAGNAYQGVGIPHCLRSGEAAARRILDSAAAK